jgi:hypothetical protein
MSRVPTFDEYLVENRLTRILTWPFRALLKSLFGISGEEWHVEQKNNLATFILAKNQKYYTFSTRLGKSSKFLSGQTFKLRFNRNANKAEVKKIKETIEEKIPRSKVTLEEMNKQEEAMLRKQHGENFVDSVGKDKLFRRNNKNDKI